MATIRTKWCCLFVRLFWWIIAVVSDISLWIFNRERMISAVCNKYSKQDRGERERKVKNMSGNDENRNFWQRLSWCAKRKIDNDVIVCLIAYHSLIQINELMMVMVYSIWVLCVFFFFFWLMGTLFASSVYFNCQKRQYHVIRPHRITLK